GDEVAAQPAMLPGLDREPDGGDGRERDGIRKQRPPAVGGEQDESERDPGGGGIVLLAQRTPEVPRRSAGRGRKPRPEPWDAPAHKCKEGVARPSTAVRRVHCGSRAAAARRAGAAAA